MLDALNTKLIELTSHLAGQPPNTVQLEPSAETVPAGLLSEAA
jgi:hypothetical protein